MINRVDLKISGNDFSVQDTIWCGADGDILEKLNKYVNVQEINRINGHVKSYNYAMAELAVKRLDAKIIKIYGRQNHY